MAADSPTNPTDYIDNPSHFSNYVMAVIKSHAEAKQAAEALCAAGFDTEDIVLSPEANQSTLPLQETKGIEHTLAEPPTHDEELFSEEGLARELYATERAKGHVVVLVRTAKEEAVEPARKVLAAHHAYAIRHVTKWTRETLSDKPGRLR